MTTLIYIARNENLRQMYLGTTCLNLDDLSAHMKRGTPAGIALGLAIR